METEHRGILYDDRQLGPYPLEKLPRVDEPTTKFHGEPQKRHVEEIPFSLARAGAYGEQVKERCPYFTVREPLGASFVDMINYLKGKQVTPVAPDRAPIPEDPRVRARHMKRLLYFLGADMVGICKIPDYARYVFPDGSIGGAGLDYAIVYMMVKDTRTVEASHGYEWIDDPVSMQTYLGLAVMGDVASGYLRNLGYQADASVIYRYKTLMTPLLIAAGLAEGSRLGIGVNPFVGANFKAAAVLTDLEMEVDKPIDFGLQEYCAHCDICVTQCRSGAISGREKEVYNQYETWKQDSRRCFVANQMNRTGQICQRCAKLCPWNRSDSRPEDFRDWDGDLRYLYDSVERQKQRRIDQNFIDERELSEKWWFPLVSEDGKRGKLVEAPEYRYQK